MKNFIEVVAEGRIDYVGSMVKQPSKVKYENILNKIKGIVGPEILELIFNLEESIIDNQRVFEIEIYKQGLKDGMELKDL